MLLRFPEGTSPPGDSFDYDVDYSIPPLTITFHDWKINAYIKQTVIDSLLQKALIQASDFEKKDIPLELGAHWQIEVPYVLSVRPRDPEPSREGPKRQISLTWGIWTNALIGINRFRTAYPELEFLFSLSIKDGGYEKVAVGNGYLNTAWGVQKPML